MGNQFTKEGIAIFCYMVACQLTGMASKPGEDFRNPFREEKGKGEKIWIKAQSSETKKYEGYFFRARMLL